MSPPETRPFSGRRFWRWYALAWLDLAGLYCVVFLIVGEASIFKAAVGSLVYVMPMALFGALALGLFRRLDWGSAHRTRLIAIHVALGALFGVGVTLSNSGIFNVLHRVAPATFSAQQLNLEYATWESLMGMLIYGVLAAVCYAILLQRRVREQEARAARATALQTEAELRALRAQLNPHFLFNTLHSMLALVRHDPRAAEEALEQFGDLLRYTLDTQKNGEVVPLREELTFVENYLALESLRLGERLRLAIDIDDTLRHRRVPAFCLQPLVENAVRHAIAPRASGGKLELAVKNDAGTLVLEVADDGAGARAETLGRASGLGLRLVRERLAAHYGEGAKLELDTAPGRGFRATIRIPREGTVD